MADNVAVTAGSGTTLATDDVSSVHYQKVKLAVGIADDATMIGSKIDTASGATDAGLPILAIRDDALAGLTPVEGDYVPLYVDANGALWVKSTDLATIAGAVSGTEMQVDVVAALPAGTNAIGKLAANSGVDIGDVDVTSVPAPLSTTGGGTEATALRVTVASDSTGVLSVDDNGGALTVDNAGTFAVQAASAGDVAHDSADSGNPVKIGAKARTTNPTAVADADRVDLSADDLGRLLIRKAARDLVTQNSITLTDTTETTLLTAVASTFLDITKLILTNTSATKVRVDIRDSTAGSVIFSVALAADGGGASLTFDPPLKQTTVNNNWTAQLSGSVTDVRIFAQAAKEV